MFEPLVGSAGRNEVIFVRTLSRGKFVVARAYACKTPNVNRVTRESMFVQVNDKFIKVVENMTVRRARGSVKPMLDNYRPLIFDFEFYGRKVLASSAQVPRTCRYSHLPILAMAIRGG